MERLNEEIAAVEAQYAERLDRYDRKVAAVRADAQLGAEERQRALESAYKEAVGEHRAAAAKIAALGEERVQAAEAAAFEMNLADHPDVPVEQARKAYLNALAKARRAIEHAQTPSADELVKFEEIAGEEPAARRARKSEFDRLNQERARARAAALSTTLADMVEDAELVHDRVRRRAILKAAYDAGHHDVVRQSLAAVPDDQVGLAVQLKTTPPAKLQEPERPTEISLIAKAATRVGGFAGGLVAGLKGLFGKQRGES